MTEIHNKKSYEKKRLVWRLTLFGLLVGLASGVVAVCYRILLTKVDQLRTAWIFGADFSRVLLFWGLFLVCAYLMHRLLLWAPYSGGSGIPQIRAELLGKIHMEVAPTVTSKFIGGILGNAGGLTLGREGPSIQLGGMWAKQIAKTFHVSEMEERYLITAGAAAGLAAAFNAPLSGALFAMEEIHKSLSHLFLLPCLAACLVANYFSFTVLGLQTAFAFKIHETLPVTALFFILLIGVLCGLVGVLFNRGLLYACKTMKKAPIPRYLVIFAIMALLLLAGRVEPLLLGGGHALIEQLSQHTMDVLPLIVFFGLRLVFVWLSYGSGAQGGIFLPVLAVGALVGALFFTAFSGRLAPAYYTNFLYLGMVGVLTAVVQAPLMSIMLVMEMSGSINIMLPMTTCAIVAFLVAKICRTNPVYESLFSMSFGRPSQEASDRKKENMTMQYYLVPNEAPYIGRTLSDWTLPPSMLIASISRDGHTFTPNGQTALKGGDEILVLCPEEDLETVHELFTIGT